ncbi:hypothetical protein KY289_019472 [Solanum tuberosum]|nr:hypothetical protein KY289_019472 [Solanum tuberosum]
MLRNLEELKLKRCRAKDDVWRLTDKDIFRSLKLLLLSELNLKGWEANSDNFPNLKRLVLKIFKDLQEIPTDFGEICTLVEITIELTYVAEKTIRPSLVELAEDPDVDVPFYVSQALQSIDDVMMSS